MNEENKNIYVSTWLLLITFLVVIMILVGGLTRLTDSGLSITKWELIAGIIPPLSLADWERYFNLYKEIPEFKMVNPNMTLDEFKIIYLWEYSHRLLGRIVGLAFIIPLIYFTLKEKISRKNLFSLYFIFFLILLQGFVGWYMVKSGLINRVDVSHYRLSLHLTLAFIIFIYLFWIYLKFTKMIKINGQEKIPYKMPQIFLFLLLLQVSIGAFVSGLDAGQIYQTWPLMNASYFPDDSNILDLFKTSVFSIPSLVQFLHRNIAYLIFIFFLSIFFIVFKDNNLFYLRRILIIILLILFLQIFLGILTVLSGAELLIASMHQLGSVILITATIILIFKNSKN